MRCFSMMVLVALLGCDGEARVASVRQAVSEAALPTDHPFSAFWRMEQFKDCAAQGPCSCTEPPGVAIGLAPRSPQRAIANLGLPWVLPPEQDGDRLYDSVRLEEFDRMGRFIGYCTDFFSDDALHHETWLYELNDP